jgi:pyruvate/2-oxoglutarate dehydrogenase complex dihydrolipoamide acyltransferase (E2) component
MLASRRCRHDVVWKHAEAEERIMATTITMPQLGESVSEGTVGRWLKQEGETVKKDESLVEIITDKVTAELPSPVSGRLVKIVAKEDETVKVGAEIAQIEEAGATLSAGAASASTNATNATNAATASSATSSAAVGTSAVPQAASAAPTAVNGAAAPRAGVAVAGNGSGARGIATQEKVSPLARRMAQEHGVDLGAIAGTGEGGRVRKEDILAYVEQRGQPTPQSYAAAPVASSTAPLPAFAGDELITPSPARRAIAEHMVRSKHTSPHAWTVFELDMTGVARWLDRHKDEFKRREGYGISFQAFVIKAAVEALKEYPSLNASWTDDGRILLRKQIHLGVSIALDNNLIVPVIRNADTLNLAGIARATSDLVTRARSNKLLPADVQGATFTVNNPGVFGTVLSAAIINQPNAAILTMDTVVKRPVVIDDAIAIRQMMFLSLSFDHRILDGATAAQFLAAIKRRVESVGPDVEVY